MKNIFEDSFLNSELEDSLAFEISRIETNNSIEYIKNKVLDELEKDYDFKYSKILNLIKIYYEVTDKSKLKNEDKTNFFLLSPLFKEEYGFILNWFEESIEMLNFTMNSKSKNSPFFEISSKYESLINEKKKELNEERIKIRKNLIDILIETNKNKKYEDLKLIQNFGDLIDNNYFNLLIQKTFENEDKAISYFNNELEIRKYEFNFYKELDEIIKTENNMAQVNNLIIYKHNPEQTGLLNFYESLGDTTIVNLIFNYKRDYKKEKIEKIWK